MKRTLLIAEIGSTTTVVTAVLDPEFHPVLGGQAFARTTVEQGDVRVGLRAAMERLKVVLDERGICCDIDSAPIYATSSAAGGLKMTVHGLVYDMTVRAAREAALGAGAVVKWVTAGKLSESDLTRLEDISPNLILLAGGVDYGESETVLHNARKLAECQLLHGRQIPPVIYAGNAAAKDEAVSVLEDAGIAVYPVENVYPRLDELNVVPARAAIQRAFEDHITNAPGMDRIRDLVGGRLMPTPGAVMRAAELLYESMGDVLVFDVGGATTDVHSVTLGSADIVPLLIHPEPKAKRTVEGDIGLYRSIDSLMAQVRVGALEKEFGAGAKDFLGKWKPVPEEEEEIRLARFLTREAVRIALDRHVGRIRPLYGPGSRQRVAEGRDLTAVQFIIGTGGALTRLPEMGPLLEEVAVKRQAGGGDRLLPSRDAEVLIDSDYIMAGAGVIADDYPLAAERILVASLKKANGVVTA